MKSINQTITQIPSSIISFLYLQMTQTTYGAPKTLFH